MYQQINRKLRRIEGRIKANERTYDAAMRADTRDMEAVDTYIHTGIRLQQQLQFELNRHSARFDKFENEVCGSAFDQWGDGFIGSDSDWSR